MRLNRYLSEVSVKDAIDDIKADTDKWGLPTGIKKGKQDRMENVQKWMTIIEPQCGQIIKEYKKADEFFYRGATGPAFVEKGGRHLQRVRPPKDTPVEVHRYLNKLFKKAFGWKVRDGVSATADRNTAQTYGGTTYLFFPVDGYAYAWSRKVADLYNWLPLETKHHHLARLKTKAKKQAAILQHKERFDELIKLYSRSGIQHALKHDSEVMFRTKKWFGINEAVYEMEVADYLGMTT